MYQEPIIRVMGSWCICFSEIRRCCNFCSTLTNVFRPSNLEQNGARGKLKRLRQMSHNFLQSEICCISSKGEQENFTGLFMIASCLPFAFGRKRDAISPNYYYWIKVSIARQNCMIFEGVYVGVRNDTFLLNYSLKPELSIPSRWIHIRTLHLPFQLIYSVMLRPSYSS